MTPRFDWTPASEPPDTSREVCVWVLQKHWTVAYYSSRSGWRFWVNGNVCESVTHWRDIEPPEEA